MDKHEKHDERSAGGLSAVLPRAQLIDRFGSALILGEFGKADLETIVKKHAPALLQIGGSVWNRIIQKKWHSVDPLHFASYFQKSDPNLYKAISTLLGVEVIRDIYYVKGWASKKKKSNVVVELVVACVYRNDLLLADVAFMDPARPIPMGQRRFALQTHKGLRLLPTFLGNMQRKAEELGCEQLTLTAAIRDLVDLFSSFGFVVEDSEMGRRGMQIGHGIPMERAMSRCEKSEAAITGMVSPIPFALRLRIRYKGATQPDVFCGSGSRESVSGRQWAADTCLLR